MKIKIISYILIAVTIGLGIVSWICLPDTVVVQMNTMGQATNTMPKILAVLLPMSIAIAGCILKLSDKVENGNKPNVLSFAGIACQILTLFFNR